MKQFGIFCFIFLAFFYGSDGSEFDFNPHEVIRQAQNAPVNLDLNPRSDKATLKYMIPTEITGNGAEGLLQNANALAMQADKLMTVLQQLLVHFDSTEGPEIEEIRNMTAQVSSFDEQFKGLVALIEQIDTTMTNNQNNVTYIEKQLKCMATSKCNIGPTSPPPPLVYNCSLPTTTQTVSKNNDAGSWVFSSPTTSACPLIIKSQKGLWINLNATVSGQGSITIMGDTSGIILGTVAKNSLSLTDVSETEISINISGPVILNINFVAVGVCDVTNCGYGTCKVNPANQPICTCQKCYTDSDDGKQKCQTRKNPCDANALLFCNTGTCIPDNTTCTYYCKCDNAPLGCKPPYCPPDPGFCTQNSESFDTQLFWKRDETSLGDEEDFDHEAFADGFNPIEFVQQAQEAETSLNFTMPDTIIEQDPYILLQDATDLTETANSLMAQLQTYLTLFNNPNNAPESNEILPYVTRLNNANTTFTPLLSKFTDLQERHSILESEFSEVYNTLKCYTKSNCHKAIPTTTPPPPPVYDCSNPTVGTVSTAGDTGNFNIRFVSTFNGCIFKIKSTVQYGLWINIKISNLIMQGSAKMIIEDPRREMNFTVASNATTFSNLTSDEITIYVNGNLQFRLDYTAINPCTGYNCGNGQCIARHPDNQLKCNCSSCYIQDGNGICTVKKINPCLGNSGLLCTYGNGKCVENSDCDYYCVCPGVINKFCETKKYCDGTTDCPPSFRAADENEKSFFSRWFKLFN